jgi:uncharacterized protein (TIGR03437 family)
MRKKNGKKNCKKALFTVVGAALVSLSFACIGWFTTRPAAGQETKAGVLRGAAAIERLKQDGQYDSLQAAMRETRFNVSRADETPLGRAAWRAPNPGAGYDAYVTEEGVSIAVNGESYVSLSLRGLGRGEALQSVGPGEVSADKQTINLMRYGGLREWYVNGPEGLEQCFTLDMPPSGDRQKGEPLRLVLQVSEGWRAEASEDGNLVTLRGKDATVEYGKLTVRDRSGRNISGRLTIEEEQVVVEVDDHSAEYPLTIDPLFTLQQRLLAADAAAGDYLGFSVALSGDTALVGAPFDNQSRGSAYVFVRNGGTWTQQTRLSAQDGASFDYFGYAVSLKGDTALVGAIYGPGGAGPDQGAVYVFVRGGTTWSQQARLNANETLLAGAQFGAAVALDGDTAIVGAPSYTMTPSYADVGVVFIFTRNGATWTQQARLNANDGEDGDAFGRTVALEGDTALIGAPNNAITFGGQGAAYVFTRSGAAQPVWTQRQRLTDVQPGPDDHFGAAVAISGDKALIGAYLYGSDDRGAMFTFRRGGAGWAQTDRTLAPNLPAGAQFGVSLALDGDLAVVGASLGFYQTGVDQRSAYVFEVSSDPVLLRRLGPELGSATDGFGYAVAVNGDTVLVGAYRSDATGIDQGAAYPFVMRDSRHVEQQKLTANDGGRSDYLGQSVALDGDTLVVGADGDDVGANGNQGSAYVFTRNGAPQPVWSLQQKLTADDGAAGDYFGTSVALRGDTLVVGAYGADVGGNANQGAAYVFTRDGTVWTQRQKLKAAVIDGLPYDTFGISVAFDGRTMAVGASGVNEYRGAVYVFTNNGAVWVQQAKLTANDGSGRDELGLSVALSGDTLVAGAPFRAVGMNDAQGSAYVFTRSGATWAQQTRLTASDGAADDRFGGAVAVSGDTLAVGAPLDTVGQNDNQGSAYVFARSGTAWIQAQKLTAADGAANDFFGYSVALGGDLLVVGAPYDTVGASAGRGSASVFTYLGYWYPQQKLTASDGAAGDKFGWSVALGGDTLAVGAGGDTVGANDSQGSAYVFASPACPAITITPGSLPNAALGAAYDQQLIASDGDGVDEPFYFAVSRGALPPGLTLDYSNGRLQGTPTAAGVYRFTITARAALSRCPGGRNYTLTVTQSCPTITVNPAGLQAAQQGATYGQTLTASGGMAPYGFTVSAGALAAGLSLSSAGALAGTPAVSGGFNFTVTVTDANGCQGARVYTLAVNGCSYTIAPGSQSFSAIAQTGNVTVVASAGCAWTAKSDSPWIKLGDFSGVGNGSVRFTIAANNGAERAGAIAVAGQTATLTQAALPKGTPRLTRLSPNAARMGTKGFVLNVIGSEFSAGHRVQWNGVDCETIFVGATQLRAVIPDAWLAQEATAVVVVVNTANGARSNLDKFRILGPVAHASAASFNTVTLASDSIVSAFGADLATEVHAAESLPLPTKLAGVSVTVRDSAGRVKLAPLFFVSPNQINYLMPPDLAEGSATVKIANGRGLTIESLTEIGSFAPGLFSANASGAGPAAAAALRVRANGEQVYEPVARYDPQTQTFMPVPIDLSAAAEQVYLILFGTGVRHRGALEDVTVGIGETELPAIYAGPTPGAEGLDQVNVLLPAGLRGRGEQTVALRVNGEISNGVNVRFQ